MSYVRQVTVTAIRRSIAQSADTECKLLKSYTLAGAWFACRLTKEFNAVKSLCRRRISTVFIIGHVVLYVKLMFLDSGVVSGVVLV